MVAQIIPIPVASPGTFGVNFEEKNALLDQRWATKADNAVIDSSGRLAARDGWTNKTTTAITSTPAVRSVFEYVQQDNTVATIVAWDGGIANDITDPESNDISGTVTDTSGTWWFQNFYNQIWGFQDGQKPISRTSGNFATVTESAGTAPTIAGGIGLCAFGRIWGLDSDFQTIKFSALLDGTDWSAGSIDMSNIWTGGTDQVTAIVAFNGRMVVFGHDHIVIWEDTTGSQLGLDPANMVVQDVIYGTGCESQWSIQTIGKTDLLFLSKHGLQSLSRVIVQKSNPVNTVSAKVRYTLLQDLINTSDKTEIRTAIDSTNGYYILTFPTRGSTYVLHYSRPFQDPTTGTPLYPITTWTLAPYAWCFRRDSTLLLGSDGVIGQYGTTVYIDNASTYDLIYESGWLSLMSASGQDKIKILKRVHNIALILAATTVIYKWAFDFDDTWHFKSVDYSADNLSEWGEAEWGSNEWSGGITLRKKKMPGSGTGQYIKLGLNSTVASQYAIQQFELMAKLGRSS